MADLIQPRTLKGFRDYPPELMMPRERLLEEARRVYRSYGFAPIDTPALEYAEILLAKSAGDGEEDEGEEEIVKQVYRFKDHGDRDVALRFDLTVPFARFAAQYIGQLGTPFRRYHMGPVWRGENTSRGRYREFWQCDFDTIGTTANAADIEVALVIHDLMRALGVEGFQIHINNRLVLNGLLEEIGLAPRARPILRALDKLAKIDPAEVRAEMMDAGHGKAGASREQADRILGLAQTRGTNAQVLDRLRRDFGGNAKAAEGISRLSELLAAVVTAGVPEERICFDVAIARGLDYYTGTIYETFLTDLPGIGSVCSGGRYDNLAGRYTKQSLPGVGASLGLDRFLAALEELKLLQKTGTSAPVLMVQFDSHRLGAYQKMARSLRAEGIGVEVFPEAKKLGQQLQYAEKRGFRAALIAGPDEFAQNVWKVKNLAKREETTQPAADVAAFLRRLLGDAEV
jgi:histidyl-tRNA synthetase